MKKLITNGHHSFIKFKKMLVNFLLCVFSGIILRFCFPRFNFFFLAYISLVPWLIVVKRSNNFRDVWWGSFLCGFIFNFFLFWWVVPTIEAAGEGVIIGIVSLTLLAIYLSLYFSVFGILIFKIKKGWIYIAPFIWVFLEYLRGVLFGRFPWLLLGYSQWNFPTFIQISEITGVYGVSFLVVFINSAIAGFVIEKKLKPVAIAFSLFIVFILFGVYKKNSPIDNKEKIRVALLQGSIDQYKKWNREYIDEIKEIFKELVEESAKKGSHLVVWPETSIPGYLFYEKELYEWTKGLVVNSKVYHLIGSLNILKGEIFNSCFLFSEDFELLGSYSKIRLTPFGETVPLKDILSKIVRILNELGGISAGKEFKVFSLPNGKFSTFICFESIFPDLVRKFVKNGAELFVNITNDAWFLRTSAPEQHFIHCVFRAVENRKFLVRVGNTGISGIINPYGEVILKSKLYERKCFFGEVSFNSVKTFYSKFGDFFSFFCIIISIIFLLKQYGLKRH